MTQQGLSATAVTYNNRNQVTNIDGLAQDYLDQGNDLRTTTGGIRMLNGPLGVTAYKSGGQTIFLLRDPAGNLMTFKPTTGTSLYYLIEPNGNVAGATDLFGYLVATYQYSPYGKTTTTGLGVFNPFRYLGSWQETNASGDPGHYKLGARFYSTNGMFTQPDALTGNLGDPRTMTSYNYAGGDPINQADPSGNKFTDPLMLWASSLPSKTRSRSATLRCAVTSSQPQSLGIGAAVGYSFGSFCTFATAGATGGVGLAASGVCFAGLGLAGTAATKYTNMVLGG